ncbi:MotA/TolQ/ExbB proton channel family protein [Providencia rettgeri]|uniref:MotA/TolQ/ExbB proton channel family protein n=1 Tax=Providencia rettgeri TaxID=587 RepID=UPI001EFD5C43|nr:MotA/TolQ/ExbB proton channel family protein [Providencia rettgeri]MCG9528458.1 MotA/TolQ/ExbB proton channel family protein [Providencia rettgeri]
MKKLRFLIYFICFVFCAFVFYIHDFIINAIEHNVAINILISVILIGGIIFALISTYQISRKQLSWKKLEQQNDVTNDFLVLDVFGHQFSDIFAVDEKKQKELLATWTESCDWKSRILEYLSGTLIGLGLLGTFIGLMGTMGSISGVLSASGDGGSEQMVQAISVPLGSMSGAFSASLMGLMSSLFTGLLAILVDKLNSRFVESVKTWIYNKNSQTQSEKETETPLFYPSSSLEPLTHQLIQSSFTRINAFCHQTEEYLIAMDSKLEAFKKRLAQGFDLLTSEITKINNVADSVNQLNETIIASNEQLRHEVENTRQELGKLNTLSLTLSENIIHEVLINRQDILQLNALSETVSQRLEKYKQNLDKGLLNTANNDREMSAILKEIKVATDNLDTSSRYNKENIDRILTIQAICHDAGLVSLDEIVKAKHYLETLLPTNTANINNVE